MNDTKDWNFKIHYEIKDEGNSPAFQAENHLTGKYSSPIELKDNEFDELEDAFRYVKSLIMSEELHQNNTLERLLEK